METTTEEVRKRRHLSPEVKYQIFIDAVKAEKSGGIGEVIRKYGIHSGDLQRIRRTAEEGAIRMFKNNKSRKPQISYNEYKAKEEEIKRLEMVIVEMAAQVVILKKKTS